MIKRANRPLRLASVAAALGLLAGCTIAQASDQATPADPPVAPEPGPPNIVFVLTDDLTTNLVPYMAEVKAMPKGSRSRTSWSRTRSAVRPGRRS